MSTVKGTHPGALWRKIDIQVHTPRDPAWEDGDSLPGGSDKNENRRKDWANDFVKTCLDNGVHAVAITDHHDFCFLEYVRQAVADADLKDSLWLFPGIEITTNDNLQCLVLLDHNASSTDCTRVLNALPNVSPTPNDDPKLPAVEPCGKTITELVYDLENITQIAGRFILLPNGSRSGGYKTILKTGNHITFRELNFDGVYIDGPFSSLKKPDRDKLYGKTHAWGNRRRGALPTSDARSLNDIGAYPCWIKLGEPTAEALRQALLVDQARIAYAAPSIPATTIDSLRVKSTLTARERTFKFNDGLNAVIGGRGSGKSALLEYLRFALGRSTADLFPFDEEHARSRSLIHDTLRDGYVVISILRDGVYETWYRDLSSPDTITIQVDDDEFSITTSEAHERVQARGYHQKQLSSLMQEPGSAREQITGLVAAEALSEESRIRQNLRNLQNEATALIGQYARAIRDTQSMTDLKVKRDDLTRRLKSLSNALEKGGLSSSQQTLLNVLPEYDEFAQTAAEASADASELESRVSEIIDEVEQLNVLRPDWEKDVNGLPSSLTAVFQARTDAVKSLKQSLNAVKHITQKANHVSIIFKPAHKAAQKSAEKIQAKQTELRQLVDQQNQLQSQLVEVRRQLRELEQRRDSPDQLLTRIDAYIDDIHRTSDELVTLLDESAQKSQELGGGLINATVKLPEEPEPLVTALKAIGEKCNIVDLENKCRAKAKDIMTQDWKQSVRSLARVLLDLLSYQVRNEDNLANLSSQECNSILDTHYIQDLTDNQGIRLCQYITSEKVAGLMFYISDPFVEFQYRDQGNEYIEFYRASPGQQASALLEVLLNQRAGPLIIDQPEDDLDNQRIMTIVETLQNTKQNRQLIFATHNPNVVVNGDADKVFSLASPEGTPSGGSSSRLRVRVDGALETKKVREEITETMEGGKHAFELRRRKYRFTG